MRFYKIVEEGCLLAIGTGSGGNEITAEEYNSLLTLIRNRPTPPEGYDYRLREDLTWEEYELPHIDPADNEISDSEALAIILGGEA
jgi:hypothetical protein